MKYEFNVYPMNVQGHDFWVAESKTLKGCVGQGDSAEQAMAELEQNEEEWLLMAKEYNWDIPPVVPHRENQFSGKISLRISPFVHEIASSFSKELGISLNQYLSDAITSYNEYYRFHTYDSLFHSFQDTLNRIAADTTHASDMDPNIIDISFNQYQLNDFNMPDYSDFILEEIA